MKATTLFVSLALLNFSTIILSMQPAKPSKSWYDQTVESESLERKNNNITRVWRPSPTSQSAAKAKEESRALRQEPMRKTSSTSHAIYYPADRPREDKDVRKTEIKVDNDTVAKVAMLFDLLPEMVAGNEAQKVQTAAALALMERMFIGMDQKIRDMQMLHTETFLKYQSEANQTIIGLQQQNVALQEIMCQQLADYQAKNEALDADNKSLRNLVKDRYERTQKTLSKLDERTQKKSL